MKKSERKKREEKWNKVLHEATWRTNRVGKFPYNEKYIDFENVKRAIENGADVDHCSTLYIVHDLDRIKKLKRILSI
jgi:hypothetical protein